MRVVFEKAAVVSATGSGIGSMAPGVSSSAARSLSMSQIGSSLAYLFGSEATRAWWSAGVTTLESNRNRSSVQMVVRERLI